MTLSDHFTQLAEAWAHVAYLRSGAPSLPSGETVEDALLMSLFYLWVLDNLEPSSDA